MPTPGERRALIFLASVAALGVGARGWHEWRSNAGAGLATDRAGLARQIEAVDSAIVAGGNRRRGSTRGRGKDSALVAGREAPSVATRHRAATLIDDRPAPERDVRAAYRLRRQHHDSLPPFDNVVRPRPSRGSPAPVDLDVATADQIESLPWIGRAVAMQIVADRAAHGPFGSLSGLQRVAGIGPGTAERLQPYVTFSLPPRPGSAGDRAPRARHRRRAGG